MHTILCEIDKDSCTATSRVMDVHGSNNWRNDCVCPYDINALDLLKNICQGTGILGMHVTIDYQKGPCRLVTCDIFEVIRPMLSRAMYTYVPIPGKDCC